MVWSGARAVFHRRPLATACKASMLDGMALACKTGAGSMFWSGFWRRRGRGWRPGPGSGPRAKARIARPRSPRVTHAVGVARAKRRYCFRIAGAAHAFHDAKPLDAGDARAWNSLGRRPNAGCASKSWNRSSACSNGRRVSPISACAASPERRSGDSLSRWPIIVEEYTVCRPETRPERSPTPASRIQSCHGHRYMSQYNPGNLKTCSADP